MRFLRGTGVVVNEYGAGDCVADIDLSPLISNTERIAVGVFDGEVGRRLASGDTKHEEEEEGKWEDRCGSAADT